MKKRITTLMATLSVFVMALTGCSKNNEPKEPEDPNFHFQFQAALATDDENKPLEFTYDVPYASLSFEKSGTEFSNDLALLSFAFTLSSGELEVMNEMYNKYGFDNVVNSADYEREETVNTVKYTIGHKTINEVDVIALSINGIGYKLPWQSNITIGKTGNHAGFQSGADIVLSALKQYLASYSNVETRKVFINGYSRSAAIGEITALTLVDENLVKEENLYAYLFETPRGVDMANEKEYKSIFNIFNSGDLVTHVAPEEYNLQRVGVDIDIYSENTDEILKTFNEKLVLKTFTPDEDGNYTNEAELANYILGLLTNPVESDDSEEEVRDMSTRENFEKYYQEYITYLVGLAFTLKQETLDDIKAEFDKLGMWDKMAFLMEDGIYNFLKPILDKHNQQYEELMLKDSLNRLLDLIKIAPAALALALSETAQESVMRTVQLHSPEVVFPLLLEYFKTPVTQN